MNMTVFHTNNKRMARSYNSAILSSSSKRSTTTTTTSTSTTTTTRPLPYSISIVEKKGCQINGQFYEIGQRIDQSSNACLDCRCDQMGMMKCDPQVSIEIFFVSFLIFIIFFSMFQIGLFIIVSTINIANESKLFST